MLHHRCLRTTKNIRWPLDCGLISTQNLQENNKDIVQRLSSSFCSHSFKLILICILVFRWKWTSRPYAMRTYRTLIWKMRWRKDSSIQPVSNVQEGTECTTRSFTHRRKLSQVLLFMMIYFGLRWKYGS